jgi:hypothetical protein
MGEDEEEDDESDSLSSDTHQQFASPSSFFLTEAKDQLERGERSEQQQLGEGQGESKGEGELQGELGKNGNNLHQVIESYVTDSILRAIAKISSKESSSSSNSSRRASRRTGKKSKTSISKLQPQQRQVMIGELSGIAHKKSPTNRFSSLSIPNTKSQTFFGKQHSMQLVENQPGSGSGPVPVPLPEFDPIHDSEHPPQEGTGGGGGGGGGGGTGESQQSKQRMTTIENMNHEDKTTSAGAATAAAVTTSNLSTSGLATSTSGVLSHHPTEDPKLTVHQLPMYFLGGVEIAGFGRILGHALALLYVARHGLKESELWSIISSMPRNDLNGPPNGPPNRTGTGTSSKSRHRQPITDEMRALVSVCAHYREKFRSVWQSNDLLHCHRLTVQKLLVGMRSVNAEFSQHDLDLLLSTLDCQPKKVSPLSSPPSLSSTFLLPSLFPLLLLLLFFV